MTDSARERLAALSGGGLRGLSAVAAYLARPAVLPVLRRFLTATLLLWIALSLWQGLWSFFPEPPPLPALEVINPASQASAPSSRESVDIDALVAAQLFGEPGASVSEEQLAAASGRAPAMSEAEAAEALAGIEDGAPDTRLPLLLRGVVASSSAGLGQAVIEHSKLQDLYQVGDELPVGGEVVLAKVLPSMVVLDNGGRYEVLRLFEDSVLTQQVPAREAEAISTQDVRSDSRSPEAAVRGDTAQLAASFRDRLYRDPESLADVVRVTAVREGGALMGYRISPGRAGDEFTTLGFEAGDIVTGVNGLSLRDPANTVRLYQVMRSAPEANFELQRNGETVMLNVSIGGTGEGNGQ